MPGREYGTIDMVAVSDVSFSPFMAFVTSVNTVLGNIFVRLLLLAALVLLGIGFLRRYRERTKEERKARPHKRAKLEEKMAFRQRGRPRPGSRMKPWPSRKRPPGSKSARRNSSCASSNSRSAKPSGPRRPRSGRSNGSRSACSGRSGTANSKPSQ